MILSIITINFNDDEKLQSTIDSVRSQVVDCEFQFLVVDGGSTDESVGIIERAEDIVDFYISEPDDGIFDAMNKGVSNSEGEFVYFLNSGDIFASPFVLGAIMGELRSMPLESPVLAGYVDTFIDGLELGPATAVSWLTHQAAFVRRDICLDFPFETSLRVFGDLDFWMRLKEKQLFVVEERDICVARMCMDGVGSHPRFWLLRVKDKFRMMRRHGGYIQFVLVFVVGFVGWLFYLFFGEKRYHQQFIGTLAKLKTRAFSIRGL